MPLSVTHIILIIVVLDIFRHYVFGRAKFPRYLLVIGGIAGLAPDLDIPLSWVYNAIMGTNVYLHGLFTHSFLVVFLLLIVGIIFHYKKNLKWAKIFYVIAAGWSLHLPLDCLFGGIDKNFLWPILSANFCPQWGFEKFMIEIDALILVFWLIHEEIHNRIRDYI